MYWDWSTRPEDIENPVAAVLFGDGTDSDPADEVSQVLAEIRRMAGPKPRAAAGRRASARDRQSRQAPRIDLVLYTSTSSARSLQALRAIREVLKRYDASQVRFSTCDLAHRPQDGDVDAVVFTPTLVKQGPGPRTSIIGNLEREDVLCDLLDASGVDRKCDG